MAEKEVKNYVPLLDRYRFEKDGYYGGIVSAADAVAPNGERSIVEPADSTPVRPDFDTNVYFAKWDAKQNKWLPEKIPTCAKELEGLRVDHYGKTKRNLKLIELMKTYGDKDGHEIIRPQSDWSWVCVSIPEERTAAQEAQEQVSAMQAQLKTYDDEALSALARGDDEALKTVREARAAYVASQTQKAQGVSLMSTRAAAVKPVQHCPMCGSVLDEEGICTGETCPMRAAKLAAKQREEESTAARAAQEKAAAALPYA